MRRFAVTAAGLLVAGGLVSSPSPAAAVATCTAVNAPLTLGKNIFYPVIAVTPNVDILPFNIGGCSGSGNLRIASCGNSSGTVTINGASANIETAGGVVVISGGAVGVGIAVPDAANGASCVAGTRYFLFTGWTCVTAGPTVCVG